MPGAFQSEMLLHKHLVAARRSEDHPGGAQVGDGCVESELEVEAADDTILGSVLQPAPGVVGVDDLLQASAVL